MTSISGFMERNYRHFNSRETLDAAKAWKKHSEEGGKMFLAMAGAMSTAQIGISLAEMIRADKIHAISCSANNLEEDIFNLIGRKAYFAVSEYRDLTPIEEEKLYNDNLSRITDVCIPTETFTHIRKEIVPLWQKAERENRRLFPYEFFYEMIRSGVLEEHYHIDPKDSWVIAACEKNLQIFTPGYEDCTTGNIFVSCVMDGQIKNVNTIRSGMEQMESLANWYLEEANKNSIGFFQIGGGIAGDFPICVVPMLIQDLKRAVPFWGYFAQIGDSTTSYGSYSGAVPNEKITWGKLNAATPKFMINSDATIVAPLIFNYVLGN
ncbi:deoxyhypusine synthase family protein [Candidatus Peribacteria bacterium]|nr:MAG: deoxyhypusine synthase family protein [Candidatus Peribacteria bacterium]